MIDEQRHDLAIEYIFESLEGDARREFEAWMQSDAELQALVDGLREATATLAHTARPFAPPPQLREKVLAIAHGESAPAAPPPTRRAGWMLWPIAAALAVGCLWLDFDRRRWRTEVRSAESEIARSFATAQAARDQATGLAEQLVIFQTQAQTHADQVANLREELVQLRGRDALAQIKIATLSTEVAAFAKAGVTVVWDPQEKRGIIKLDHLPTPAAGKDYQLWVIDPQQAAPVSAGVLPVSVEGDARVAFKPAQAIEAAGKFAISIEQTGGVAQVAGPIVFIGE